MSPFVLADVQCLRSECVCVFKNLLLGASCGTEAFTRGGSPAEKDGWDQAAQTQKGFQEEAKDEETGLKDLGFLPLTTVVLGVGWLGFGGHT